MDSNISETVQEAFYLYILTETPSIL